MHISLGQSTTALSVLILLLFGVSFLSVAHAAPGDKVCPDHDPKDPNSRKSADGSVTKTISGGVAEGKQLLSQQKKETHDRVEVGSDGKVTLISKCGEEGTTGTVTFCILGGACSTHSKDQSSTQISNDIQKKMQGLKKSIEDEAVRAVQRGQYPSVLNGVLTRMAESEGCGAFASAFGVSCIEKAQERLTSIAQTKEQDFRALLRGVIDGNEGAVQKALQDAGLSYKMRAGDFARLQSAVTTIAPQSARELQDTQKLASLVSGATPSVDTSSTPRTGSTFRPPGGTQTTSTDDSGLQTTGDPATDLQRAGEAIACIESGCGDYSADNGLGCYGKYQVCAPNIPSWTRQALGRSITAAQFLACPQCQEQVFAHKFTEHLASCGGNYTQAAVKWFTGKCTGSGRDAFGTTAANYAAKFNSYFTQFGGTASPFAAGTGSPFSKITGASPSSLQGLQFGSISSAPATIQGIVDNFKRNFNASTGGGSGINPSTPTNLTPPTQQTPVPGTSTGTQGGGSTPGTQTERPVLTLAANPRIVQKGDSVQLVWSTANIRTGTTCRLLDGQQELARGNGGVRVVQMPASITAAEKTYELRCSGQSQQATSTSVTVTIQ